MPSFEHLTIQDRDVKANILAIGSANNAVPGQWYLATNTNEYFYGAQDGSLVGPLIPQNAQFIQSIADSNGIDLEVTLNVLTAALKMDAAADNLLSLSAAGLYAKKYTIHPDSQPYLEIDASNQIKTKQLLITDTTVDTTETSIGDYITTSGYAAGNLIHEEGDVIVLTQVQNTWIHNGGTAGNANDFTEISADVTDSYIRNLFSGNDGVDYNPSTGAFSLNQAFTRGLISGIAPVSYNSTNGEISIATNGIGNTHLRQGAANSVIGRATGTVGNVADIAASADNQFLVRRSGSLQFGALQASDIQTVGAITTANNGLTKVGNNVKLGGALTEDTTIGGIDKKLLLNDKEIIFKWNNINSRRTIDYSAGLSSSGWRKNQIKIDTTKFPANAYRSSHFRLSFISGRYHVLSTFVLFYDPSTPTITIRNEIGTGRIDYADAVVLSNTISRVGTEDLIDFWVNASSLDIGVHLCIECLSGGYYSADDIIKSISASTWVAETPPSYNKHFKINEKLVISTQPSSEADYLLDIKGDTRITSGLWVGAGSPPTNLADGVISAYTGFRINNAAASGQYLRGNGTNFVASNLLASDITGIVPITKGGTGLSTLGTPGQILKVNAGGTALEYANEAAADPYTFENGLTKDGSDVVRLGGDLTQNSTIGLQGFNIHFTQTTGKITFFSASPGPSDFNIYDKDLEIISANPGTVLRGLILTKADGTRVHATVGPNNQWEITPI